MRHGSLEEQAYDLFELARDREVITTREVEAHGIRRLELTHFVQTGLLERVARGVYVYPLRAAPPYQRIAVVCKLNPRGAACLLSAAFLHGLLPDEPPEVWVTVEPGGVKPKVDWIDVEAVYMRRHLLEPYVEVYGGAKTEIRLTTAAKTVVDAFRFRRRVGKGTALKLLAAYLEREPGGVELLETAAGNRMAGVLRPYVEALAR